MNDYQDVQVFDGTQSEEIVVANDTEINSAADASDLRTTTSIQGVVHLAKQFPRNKTKALKEILDTCGIYKFAEKAIFKYKRGKEEISGANIRLAELIAQCWGNMLTGVHIRESSPKQSEVEVYAWDVENNVYCSRVFIVKHLRDKSDGPVELRSERDKYEIAMNMASRRLRACILSAIPRYVQDDAVAAIHRTVAQGDGRTGHPERINAMIKMFGEIGITEERLKNKLGHSLDRTTGEELADMGGVYNALCAGEDPAEYFKD